MESARAINTKGCSRQEARDKRVGIGGAGLYAHHGEGSWQPEDLFRDLAEMVATMAILGEIITPAGELLADVGCLMQPRYLAEARERLTLVAGSPQRAAVILNTPGRQASG